MSDLLASRNANSAQSCVWPVAPNDRLDGHRRKSSGDLAEHRTHARRSHVMIIGAPAKSVQSAWDDDRRGIDAMREGGHCKIEHWQCIVTERIDLEEQLLVEVERQPERIFSCDRGMPNGVDYCDGVSNLGIRRRHERESKLQHDAA